MGPEGRHSARGTGEVRVVVGERDAKVKGTDTLAGRSGPAGQPSSLNASVNDITKGHCKVLWTSHYRTKRSRECIRKR